MDGAQVRDPYEDCRKLERAGELMNGRVAKIMRAIYDEEEKPNPDGNLIGQLEVSKRAVAQDREAMRDGYPHGVEAMIAKYRRLKDAQPTVHE